MMQTTTFFRIPRSHGLDLLGPRGSGKLSTTLGFGIRASSDTDVAWKRTRIALNQIAPSFRVAHDDRDEELYVPAIVTKLVPRAHEIVGVASYGSVAYLFHFPSGPGGDLRGEKTSWDLSPRNNEGKRFGLT